MLTRRLGSALLIGGLILTSLSAAQEAQQAPPASQPSATGTPKLDISQREYNFGEVWQGTPVSVTVTLKNTGDAALTLDVKSSCGCTVPSKPKSPLAPDESDVMTIKYDSIHRKGPTAQTVTITSNDPANGSIPFKVIGTVKPLFELKPVDTLAFGRLFQHTEASRTIEITNLFTSPVALKLKPDQDFGPFDVTLEEVESGQHYRIIAKTKPPLQVGTARNDVVIETTAPDYPEMKITIYGSVQPPITLYPSRLFLPKSAVDSIDQTLRVVSSPEKPVRVVEVKPSHSSIKAEIREVKKPDAPDAPPSQEIVITLPPGDKVPDGVELSVEVTTDWPDEAYRKIIVPIRVIASSASQPAPIPAPVPNPTPGH